MSGSDPQSVTILVAEDDEDDRLLIERSIRKHRVANRVEFVRDGQDLMDYLNRREKYADSSLPPPDLILLDLNMPRKDGREALAEIRSDQRHRRVPVIVLTASKVQEDNARSLDLGADGYIRKPVTLAGLIEATKDLDEYWFEIVKLPSGPFDT